MNPTERRAKDLDARLRAVERSQRRDRAFFGTAGLVGLALLLGGARGSDEVTASRFRLVGADGKTRSVWEIADGVDARLALFDARGIDRLEIRAGASGRPTLEIRDAKKVPRARLVAADETSLNFYDRTGKIRTAIGVTAYGPAGPAPLSNGPAPAASADSFFHPEFFSRDVRDAATRRNVEPDDGPVLKLYDRLGVARLEARADGDQPWLVFVTGRKRIQSSYPKPDERERGLRQFLGDDRAGPTPKD